MTLARLSTRRGTPLTPTAKKTPECNLSDILMNGPGRVVEQNQEAILILNRSKQVNSTTALKPVSRTTLSEQVALQLASELDAKRWRPGEKLPSEAELCKVFNVGRSTLREALKSLSFIGLIRMRAGEGSYVADQKSRYMEGPLLLAKGVLNSEKEVNDLCEARLLIETELAALCAQRATLQDFRALEKIVRDMKTAIDDGADTVGGQDLSFHMAVAAASRNEVLATLLKNIQEALHELIEKSLHLPAGMELAYQQHRTLLEALKQRNPSIARKAMRTHLRAFQRGYRVLFQSPHP
jgi:GntR family transcriptional repressor for pyruvate dehydrogenase complex